MQGFVKNSMLKYGRIVKPIVKDGRVIGQYIESNDILYKVNKSLMLNEDLIAMFPSDLEGTILEDIWVEGYDPIPEEVQDKYMDDFFKWCELNCTSKFEGHGGHTVFKFSQFK